MARGPSIPEEKIQEITRAVANGETVAQACESRGVSKTTYFKRIRRDKAQALGRAHLSKPKVRQKSMTVKTVGVRKSMTVKSRPYFQELDPPKPSQMFMLVGNVSQIKEFMRSMQ